MHTIRGQGKADAVWASLVRHAGHVAGAYPREAESVDAKSCAQRLVENEDM